MNKCELCGIPISRGRFDYGCAQQVLNHASERECAIENCVVCAARKRAIEDIKL